jgi:hypothetical protein
MSRRATKDVDRDQRFSPSHAWQWCGTRHLDGQTLEPTHRHVDELRNDRQVYGPVRLSKV